MDSMALCMSGAAEFHADQCQHNQSLKPVDPRLRARANKKQDDMADNGVDKVQDEEIDIAVRLRADAERENPNPQASRAAVNHAAHRLARGLKWQHSAPESECDYSASPFPSTPVHHTKRRPINRSSSPTPGASKQPPPLPPYPFGTGPHQNANAQLSGLKLTSSRYSAYNAVLKLPPSCAPDLRGSMCTLDMLANSIEFGEPAPCIADSWNTFDGAGINEGRMRGWAVTVVQMLGVLFERVEEVDPPEVIFDGI